MILASFAAIPHIEVLRIGSRVPVVMPMRITKDLCRILKRYRPLWFNTQFNHPIGNYTGSRTRLQYAAGSRHPRFQSVGFTQRH
ncbi:MAG: hypothetical protein MZV70_47760 [Desulfobacterales bacterium]|nr:hypothetical protein [Desulfobacterales bacterium]